MIRPTPASDEPRHARGSVFVAWLRLPRLPLLVLGILLGGLYCAALVASLGAPLRGDEPYHYAQVHLFRHGDGRILDLYLTTIPGFHAAVAAVMAACGLDTPGAARAINAGFGLVAAAGFHALRQRSWPGTETIATAQFLALPILAPLFFLVYTDVLALALILWATVAALAGRHVLAALALLAVVLVRQNDVVWAVLVASLAATPVLREHRGREALLQLRAFWPYLVPIAAFCAFWAWNGSISLSRAQAAFHPLTLKLGNPYFALLLAGALLPLQVLAGLGRFAQALRARPWLLVLPVAGFALYAFGFHADNPYNAALPDHLPRNALLLKLEADPIWRVAAGLAMMLAACGLGTVALRPRAALLLYPLAALFLAASWLIEQRYAIVPLVMWLAFREHRGRAVELATLALWLLLAVWVISGVLGGRFFL